MKIWEDNGRRFKRPLKILQEGEILLQVLRQGPWKKTPKRRKSRRLHARKSTGTPPGTQINTHVHLSVFEVPPSMQVNTYAPSGVVCAPMGVHYFRK